MKTYGFGVDVGGTTVKMGLFKTDGTLMEKWEIPTRKEDNGSYILPDIAASIEAKLAEHSIDKADVQGIGIGVPGPVKADGSVSVCVNLGWGYVHVKNEMEKMTGLETRVGNDANVAALGEAWKGAGQGTKNAILLTLGTGVGGGIIIDGKILTGVNGAGAEVGHVPVNPDETEVCGCGKKGCLEQYASATGVARLARRRLAKDDVATPLRDITEIIAKDVFDYAKEGDAVALEILEEFGNILGTALATFGTVIDPEVILLGGGVSKAGDILVEVVEKYYKKLVFPTCKDTPIRLATLGNDAGIVGCVGMLL